VKPLSLALVALLCLGAARHSKSSTPGLSLDPRAWDVRYSSGVRLEALAGMAGWSFLFPSAPGHVNYLTTTYTTPLHAGQTVSASLQIAPTAGDPVFHASECGTATVRLYLEQAVPKHCPDATYSCAGPTYRWWSNPDAVTLSPGQALLSVPIDPDEWSDAEGKAGSDPIAAAGFINALAHPAMVGLTFGGCFFGHGVNVSGGSARFILTSVAIQ